MSREDEGPRRSPRSPLRELGEPPPVAEWSERRTTPHPETRILPSGSFEIVPTANAIETWERSVTDIRRLEAARAYEGISHRMTTVSRVVVLSADTSTIEEWSKVVTTAFPKATVLATATLTEAVDLAATSPVEVVLVDLGLFGDEAAAAIERIHATRPEVAVIAILDTDDIRAGLGALQAGAQEVVAREGAGAALMMRSIIHAIERRRPYHEIERLAYFDSLTGLPNRPSLQHRLALVLEQARISSEIVALLFLDLDDFKLINDTLGHRTGDHVLRIVAQRIKDTVGPFDTACRWGGDEFIVLLRDRDTLEAVHETATALLEAIRTPISIEGYDLYVTASGGIVASQNEDIDAETMNRRADLALYRAKEKRRSGIAWYTAEMDAEARDLLDLSLGLRRAVARGEFRLHYQPQVDVVSGRVCGVEALLRWTRPDGTVISPAAFVPILERTNLIHDAGQWVVSRAIADLLVLHERGFEVPRVSVNISPLQLRNDKLVRQLRSLISDSGLPDGSVELEITESALFDSETQARSMLGELRDHGLRIALDDFGTGYSSMMQLVNVPFHTLKIDRAMSSLVGKSPRLEALLTTVIELAHRLRLELVAEGIETLDQQQRLVEMGVHVIQGYYVARPMPLEALMEWLDASDWECRPHTSQRPLESPAATSFFREVDASQGFGILKASRARAAGD